MMRQTTFVLLGAAVLGVAACGQLERPGKASPPDVSVTVRAAGGAAPVTMATCAEVSGPVEVTVGASDMEGLAAIRMTFTGPFSGDGVRVSPGGSDIVLTEGGLPGQEDVSVTIGGGAGGTSRTSVSLSFVTAAPHTGVLNVAVTDRTGATTRSGPNSLVASGGCS